MSAPENLDISNPTEEQAKAESLKCLDEIRARIASGEIRQFVGAWLYGDYTASGGELVMGDNHGILRMVSMILDGGMECDCGNPLCPTDLYRDEIVGMCKAPLFNQVRAERQRGGKPQ